ncbi:MAG: cysteine--tRNA ligase [Desulfobacterales bacterium]|nr:MAG: cysteine--tRNA ligase [Desulfobacterales bacterium]
MVYNTILDAVGNTPLVRINRLVKPGKVRFYAKLEYFNPGGSIKERISLSMIEGGERSGELTKDKIVLEATSGNTGIGLAMVCAARGYRCLLVMSESASVERRKILQAYGAEILLTPANRGTDGAIEKAYALAREFPGRYFLTDQYNNEDNWRAHYNVTAPELWEQSEHKLTHIVATLGTSGTVMGLAAWFKEYQPHVQVIGVEPPLGHKIQGLKNMKESYRPGIFNKKIASDIVSVEDENSFKIARRLASDEGLLVGIEEKKSGKKSELRFFNTLTKKKEVFKPLKEKEVTLYSCGPTACEPAHLLLCRRFIVTDLITRYLEAKGMQVNSYMNFTDLDDNTIQDAEAAGENLAEYTGKFIDSFMQDIDILGVKHAAGYPKASEHVEEMIEIASDLVDKGYAYEKHGSIYFDISKFSRYGRLSGIDLSHIQVGKTVDLDDYEKDNPRDFTLLKRSTLAELKRGIFFESKWGNIRPGWHVECSVMATRHLGETLDIHTASRNLMFPHHENEIAIAEALTGKPLSRYWLHSELLLVDGKMMARENNNTVTVRDLLDQGYSGREIRFFLLTVHYRKPIHFSLRRLQSARTALRRLDDFFCKLNCLPSGKPHPEIVAYVSDMEEQFYNALDDDLNVSRAMSAVYKFIKRTNPIMQMSNLDRDQKGYILESFTRLNEILQVFNLKGCPLRPEINALIEKREKARLEKDWKTADSVRDELERQGITVIDTESGPVWRKLQETLPPGIFQEMKPDES